MGRGEGWGEGLGKGEVGLGKGEVGLGSRAREGELGQVREGRGGWVKIG